jgi:flagellar protein FliO/FliZ
MDEAAILRLIVSLAFIIALILAGAWMTRRAGWLRSGPSQPIKVIGSQSLGARAYVAVVQVDNTRLVLGVTSSQISLLHTLPGGEPTAPTPAPEAFESEAGFAHSLRQILSRRRV